jgi:hypothetical protein
MKKKTISNLIFFLFFLALTQDALANLRLDISIVRKSGINKGLVLTSEVHSSEPVVPGVWRKMTSNTGIVFTYLVDFYLAEGEMGPSKILSIRGHFPGANNSQASLSDGSVFIPIGESKSLEVRPSEGQIYEVTLAPKVLGHQ